MISRYNEVKLTPEQSKKMDIVRVAFMTESPFYSHLFYSLGKEVFTRDIETAATDGRHIMINPDYVLSFRVSESVFILAHEMSHLVGLHCQRFKHYGQQNALRSKPWIQPWANICADLVINADLVDTKVGSINPDWLLDPNVKADELWEDVYVRTFPKLPPPPPQGNQGGQQGQGQPQPGSHGLKGKTARESQGGAARGAKGDPKAQANGGSFDQVLEPTMDPATGKEDLPEEHEFKEAIARAAQVAKARGQMPERLQRMVDELLQPKVDWRDHIRLLMTGKIGTRHETWTRPNRRRLALNPLVIMPGRRGYGADTVVVGVDTSGSISEEELQAFMTEVGGILTDCKPRRIVVIGCDAMVETVEDVRSLDEVRELNARGLKGGGGTFFSPVFDYVKEHELRPDTLVYLTDGYPSVWPSKEDYEPAYPVIWAITSDEKPTFGEWVRLKLED